jgi:hypothetical protein
MPALKLPGLGARALGGHVEAATIVDSLVNADGAYIAYDAGSAVFGVKGNGAGQSRSLKLRTLNAGVAVDAIAAAANGDVTVLGVLAVNAATLTSAVAGEIVLKNALAVRGVNSSNNNTISIVRISGTNKVEIDPGGVGAVTGGALTVTAGGLAVLAGIASFAGGASITGANAALSFSGAAGARQYLQMDNTGGSLTVGMSGSGAGSLFTNAPAYSSVVGSNNATSLALGTNGVMRVEITSAGSLVIGGAAVATNATDGFPYMPTCAGAPTGVPSAFAGRAPFVFDSTNNFLYFYVGGSWKKSTVYA